MKEYEVLTVHAPASSTAAGVTGSYVDTQGFVGHGHKNVMFVLAVAPGTTAGTAGGSIQTAQDTAGTGVATLVTFTTQTSAGGFNAQYGVIPASHRYVRFLGTVQSAKDMRVGAIMVAMNRYSP